MMADRVKVNPIKTVKNPLLSGAGVGFPFENFSGSSLLVPVPRESPPILVEDVGEVDTFVGQETPVSDDPAPSSNSQSTSETISWAPQRYTGLFSSFFGGSQTKEEPPEVKPAAENIPFESTPRSFSPYVHVPNVQSFSPALFVPDTYPKHSPSSSQKDEKPPISQLPHESTNASSIALAPISAARASSNPYSQQSALPPSVTTFAPFTGQHQVKTSGLSLNPLNESGSALFSTAPSEFHTAPTQQSFSPVEPAHSTSSSSDSIVNDLQNRFGSAEVDEIEDKSAKSIPDERFTLGPIQADVGNQSFPQNPIPAPTPFSLFSPIQSDQFVGGPSDFDFLGRSVEVKEKPEQSVDRERSFGAIGQPVKDLQAVTLQAETSSKIQSNVSTPIFASEASQSVESTVPPTLCGFPPAVNQPVSSAAPLQTFHPSLSSPPLLTGPPKPFVGVPSSTSQKYRLGSQKRLAYAPVPGLSSGISQEPIQPNPTNTKQPPLAPPSLFNPLAGDSLSTATPPPLAPPSLFNPLAGDSLSTATPPPPPSLLNKPYASPNTFPEFNATQSNTVTLPPVSAENVSALTKFSSPPLFDSVSAPTNFSPFAPLQPGPAVLPSAYTETVPASTTFPPTQSSDLNSSAPSNSSLFSPPQPGPAVLPSATAETVLASTTFSPPPSSNLHSCAPSNFSLYSPPQVGPEVLPSASIETLPASTTFSPTPFSDSAPSPPLKVSLFAPPQSSSAALPSAPVENSPLTTFPPPRPPEAAVPPTFSPFAPTHSSPPTLRSVPLESYETVSFAPFPASSASISQPDSPLPTTSPPASYSSNSTSFVPASTLFNLNTVSQPPLTYIPTQPLSADPPNISSSAMATPSPNPSQLNTVDLSVPQHPRRSPSPSVVPPRLLNLGQSGLIYRPPYYHWFLRGESDGKEVWEPFSMTDSFEIEQAFNSAALTMDTVVATDGGRYDVHVVGRKRESVFWQEPSREVRRCSWFHRSNAETRFRPYDENTAYILEEEYKAAVTNASWNRRVPLNNGEYVVLYGPTSMAHFLSAPPGNDGWEASTELSQQSQARPRVVKRGVDDFDIDDGETADIDHLLFVVHGIGSVCDLKMRTIEEAVNDFRSISHQLVKTHYQTSVDGGEVSRIEVLPVSWHHNLHGDTGVDNKLSKITLKSIPKLRHFTNDTLLDILFYTSPTYCQNIMDQVGQELNKQFELFRQRNPSFRGGVSVAGHSLGSLILFDMLCHQKRVTDEAASESSLSNTNKLTRTASYVTGTAGTGQPFITYPQLSFQPNSFFALGSPIGMFVTVRGIDSLGLEFRLPTCPGFYNIFHPFDPVAYRIEALINPELSSVRPVLIPHHKGRKRMHLELRETMARVGADLKQRLMDSVRGTWNAVYQLTTFGRSEEALEQEVDQAIASQMSRSRVESTSVEEEEIDVPSTGVVNQGRRVDYVLQEAPLESFNEYVSAITSHVCYWDSEDTVLFILKDIYNNMGITADSPAVIAAAAEEQAASTSLQQPPSPPSPNSFVSTPQLPAMGMDPTVPIRTPSNLPPPPMAGFTRK